VKQLNEADAAAQLVNRRRGGWALPVRVMGKVDEGRVVGSIMKKGGRRPNQIRLSTIMHSLDLLARLEDYYSSLLLPALLCDVLCHDGTWLTDTTYLACMRDFGAGACVRFRMTWLNARIG
jgi:hypothetical protein